MSIRTLSLVAILSVVSVGCGLPSGTHLRVVTATPQQIASAARGRERVYYEFEAGDQVPIVLGLLGVLEATAAPVPMVAKRAFAILVEPSGTMAFVLDGRRLTSADVAARWTILFRSAQDGTTVSGVVIGLGTDDDLR